MIKSFREIVSNNRKIFSNFNWLVADKVIRLVLGLLVNVQITRYLGPEQVGLLSYALVYVSFFSFLIDFGDSRLVVKYIVEKTVPVKSLMGTDFVLKMCGAVIAFFIIVGVQYVYSDDVYLLQMVSLLAAVNLLNAIDGIDYWFQSQVQSKYIIIAQNIPFVLFSFWRLRLVYIHASLFTFVVCIGLEAVFKVALYVFFYQRQAADRLRDWRYSSSIAKMLLKKCIPLAISSLVITVYMKIDQVMLKNMLDDTAVGIYATGIKFSEILYFIPTCVVSSVLPKFLSMRERETQKYKSSLEGLFSLASLFSYIVIFMTVFISDSLIDLLYGQAFKESATILNCHIVAFLFVFIGCIRSIWMTGEDLFQFDAVCTTIGAIVNVALNYLLIPQYAGIGAAIATIVSYGTAAYLCGLFFLETRPVFLMQTKGLLLIGLRNMWGEDDDKKDEKSNY